MSCPYCGNRDESKISQQQPLVNEQSARELAAMGIEVPMIQQCKVCTHTLKPQAFMDGTPDWMEAHARVQQK